MSQISMARNFSILQIIASILTLLLMTKKIMMEVVLHSFL